jgi:hypothetical protein
MPGKPGSGPPVLYRRVKCKQFFKNLLLMLCANSRRQEVRHEVDHLSRPSLFRPMEPTMPTRKPPYPATFRRKPLLHEWRARPDESGRWSEVIASP